MGILPETESQAPICLAHLRRYLEERAIPSVLVDIRANLRQIKGEILAELIRRIPSRG